MMSRGICDSDSKGSTVEGWRGSWGAKNSWRSEHECRLGYRSAWKDEAPLGGEGFF